MPAGATACIASVRSTTRRTWPASTKHGRFRWSGTATCRRRGGAPAVTIRCRFSAERSTIRSSTSVNHPTSQAGITCTVCHAITNVNSTRGNADYTIEEPLHYPFAYSDNAVLAVDQQSTGQGEAVVPQEDVSQAVSQDGRVLLDLPQGASAVGTEPLQGVPARPEPLRSVPAQRRLGPRCPQFLLSAPGARRTATAVTCRCSRRTISAPSTSTVPRS